MDHLIGKTVEEARQELEPKGNTVRVVSKDGQPMMVTMDYRENRLNVEIVDNKIVKIAGWS